MIVEFDGVVATGVSVSPGFRLFLLVSEYDAPPPFKPSSSALISGNPDSIPSKVRSNSSRSFLNRRSVCSRRLSSTYSASSSAICTGVRSSRVATYLLRNVSRSSIAVMRS